MSDFTLTSSEVNEIIPALGNHISSLKRNVWFDETDEANAARHLALLQGLLNRLQKHSVS